MHDKEMRDAVLELIANRTQLALEFGYNAMWCKEVCELLTALSHYDEAMVKRLDQAGIKPRRVDSSEE